MTTWVGYAVFLSVVMLLPLDSFAQAVDVGISGVDLVSIQPRDDAFIGGPYLNEGLGGVGRGWGAGVNVITPGGFVMAGEFNTARFEQLQSGRLVGGSGETYDRADIPHSTRWRNSMLTGLIGYTKSAGRTRVLYLGGVTKNLGTPTVDEAVTYEARKVAITGGLDLWHTFAGRVALVINGRYSNVKRDNVRYLGVGPHVLRIGVGLRIRIN